MLNFLMPVVCNNHISEQNFTTKHFQTKYPISIHCALVGMSFGFSHSIASKKSYISKRKVHCPLMSWFFQSTDITGNPSPLYRGTCKCIVGFQLLELIIMDLKSQMTCYNSMPLIGWNNSIRLESKSCKGFFLTNRIFTLNS